MDYSILVNSCDSYSDVWDLFFSVLKKTWRGTFPVVYLNTEKKTYETDDLHVEVLNVDKDKIEWGERLINALVRIPNDYVLMLLEDFIFEDYIKTDIIERCCDHLKEDANILAYQLTPNGEFEQGIFPKNDDVISGFAERRRGDLFTIVAGPTLWRKADLIALTKKKDNPWEWEFFGSFRTILYGKKVMCWKSKSDCIFDYDVDHGGIIHRGKWVGYKLRELEEKYDLKIGIESREVVEDWMKMGDWNKPIPRIRRIKTIVKNRVRMLTNTLYGLKCRL